MLFAYRHHIAALPELEVFQIKGSTRVVQEESEPLTLDELVELLEATANPQHRARWRVCGEPRAGLRKTVFAAASMPLTPLVLICGQCLEEGGNRAKAAPAAAAEVVRDDCVVAGDFRWTRRGGSCGTRTEDAGDGVPEGTAARIWWRWWRRSTLSGDLSELAYLWDGSDPGWVLHRVDHFEFTVVVSVPVVNARVLATLRRVLWGLRDRRPAEVRQALSRGEYRVAHLGHIAHRQLCETLEAAGVAFHSEVVDLGGYLPVKDGTALLIEDEKLGREVAERMLAAGVPVLEVHVD
ncbi:MAG: hypothetical protein H6737_24120 [Alphaproteobacteria bacterium]|nr:hypothetical protein [Alphaproteobacteria bacterium]